MSPEALAPVVAPVWAEVAAALPEGYRGAPTTSRPAGASGRAWRITLPGRRTLALKLAAGGAPVEGEARALIWLGERGAPVPRVLAVDSSRPARWLALEWCGEATLDEALQGVGPRRRAALGRRLVGAVAAVEAAFGPVGEGLRRQPGWGQRVAALREQAAPWAAAAPEALSWLLGRPQGDGGAVGDVRGALRETVELALGATPDVGSLDYNPTNVVLGTRGRLTLVDFAATGVDWPERRLVQYGTATGAAGGTFRSALGPASVRAYAAEVGRRRGVDVDRVVATVDAHEVLLLLAAAAGLRSVADGVAHPGRARAWGDVPERRAALLTLLGRRLVTDGPAARGPAAAVRAAVRRASRPSTATNGEG